MFLVVRVKRLAAMLAAGLLVMVACIALGQALFGPALTADAAAYVDVPILMYHSVLKDARQTGTYVITPDQLKSDLEYLSENGYESVTMQDLIAYVAGAGTLPEKPVMLTFDDGHLNNLTYAQPLLEAYHMQGVLSIVGMYSDQATEDGDNHPGYSYVSWPQVTAAQADGVFEIQNHSYEMHHLNGRRKGTLKVSAESEEQYRQALSQDLGRMQEKIEQYTGMRPTTFTYPFGFVSKSSQDIIKALGFQATLTCEEGVSRIVQGDPQCLFGLKRILRSGTVKTATVMKTLEKAMKR